MKNAWLDIAEINVDVTCSDNPIGSLNIYKDSIKSTGFQNLPEFS